MFEQNNNGSDNDKIIKGIEASVKWYNPIKGYGFLSLSEIPCDIMIHFSALDKIGCPYIKVGDRVICDVACGKTGPNVVRVIEVKFGSPEPRSLSHFIYSRFKDENFKLEELKEIEGTVKWYNPDKRFGFIIPDDGTREILFRSFVLNSIGHHDLKPGTRVLAKVINSERGPDARAIRILFDVEEDKRVS